MGTGGAATDDAGDAAVAVLIAAAYLVGLHFHNRLQCLLLDLLLLSGHLLGHHFRIDARLPS